jgi:hypothetical protein
MPTGAPVPPPFLKIPKVDNDYRDNWLALQNWSRTLSPFAGFYGATATCPTVPAGAPIGAEVGISFTAATKQDDWHMINPNHGLSDATWVRFPYDGLYSAILSIASTDSITTLTEWQLWYDYAATAQTGYSAPSFITGVNSTSYGHIMPSGTTRARTVWGWWPIIAANAGDIIRFHSRVISTQSLVSVTVGMNGVWLNTPYMMRPGV